MIRKVSWWGYLLLYTTTVGAQEESGRSVQDMEKVVQELQIQLETMRSEFQTKIADLESRLLQVSASRVQPSSEQEPPAQDSSGGQRTLQRLNPEISVLGDVTGRLSDNSTDDEFNRLNFDGFEASFQHPLDPYTTSKFYLVYEEGKVDLEEGYITWASLPGNLGLKVGRFHTNFGRMNRVHKHALSWVDRDLPTETIFGHEGLIGDGVSLNWLTPKLPWADANELSFEIINNSNDLAFSGRGFSDPVYIGRLMNYRDLTEDAYFEWGLSAATSHWDLDQQNRSTVVGLDLNYRFEPLQNALYRSFQLNSEFFYNVRDRWPGGNVFGFFASAEYQLSRRWYAGMRYQSSDALENNDEQSWSISPFLTFWQSEWVRLRAQYDFLNRNLDVNDNRLFFQVTWAMGPHKHEEY